MATTFRTLTVQQLIDLLEGESPDARVIFSTDYGDYYHTPQALPLNGEVDTVQIEKSAYSNSGFAIAQDEEDEECKPEHQRFGTFLVIR